METETLTWVDEVMPVMTGDPGDPDIEFGDHRLTGPMRSLLAHIADEPDTHTCMANTCTAAIGWVLHEPADHGDRGGLQWAWTTVVETSAGVLAVCEDCTPSVVYNRT